MMYVPIDAEEDIARAVAMTEEAMSAEGFGLTQRRMMATAVSELATNAYVHATKGTVTIAVLDGTGGSGIEITVEDQGPGIENLEQAMVDGYSSAGSLGVGLPGARRLADEFSIHSTADKGTVTVVRAWLV
ncbi:anti-sigma regulatory factor [Candidatus Marimicrobium litorale]|uniref:Anti-sigma regulatory factor n=1 Tax=Candidatus Marimicrobium litorale TaxID=2518991 RepID=A0ABT3TBE8_9GAMM|nr:anti-sigma regulatory factor [Candidatus Marimicrobium litorale]MCX2978779.1 anti-sigma regulatory factor [Candidatus Marimicrobium litorale]